MSRNHYELAAIYLTILQYVFFILMLGCIIAIVWAPGNWLQIAATAVLLLFAGATCKTGRR